MSPSSRRAWIEIMTSVRKVARYFVALLAEGVDRNSIRAATNHSSTLVALLAEGVDRNKKLLTINKTVVVALLAEGVDRNF